MKISILTACCNCAPYIDNCINSVLRQNYEKWEMLILEDKSTDKSSKIIRKYTSDTRIKMIEVKKKLFCGAAYNYLSKLAMGEISCVLDADDALLPHSMISLIDVYNRTSADYVYTQFLICNKAKLKKIKKGWSCIPPKGQSFLDTKHAFSHWRTYKTSMRERADIFPTEYKRAVDKWMGYALEEVGRGVFYNKVLYLYRERNAGHSVFSKKCLSKIRKKFINRRQNLNIQPIPVIEYK